MTLLIIFFLVSIIFSFLCSLWEASLLTIPPSYVETQSQTGSEYGRLLKEYKTNVDRPLSAILTLNTVAHTVGAIGVGASATKVWPGNELMTGAVVPVVMTLAILILSEIIPKTIGATRWKAMAPFTVKSLKVIQWLTAPLLWVISIITKGLKGEKDEVTVSRTDMAALATLSRREGVLEESESTVMQNLLTFREVLVKDVMTPRTVMEASAASMTVKEYLDAHTDLRFSRIPVFKESRDQIESYVLKDDVLIAAYKGKDSEPLKNFARPIMAVADDLPIPTLLKKLLEKNEHIALVVGDFGGTAGLVTQEDVIETLLGLEIMDETDDTTDMQAVARKIREARAKRGGIESNVIESPEAIDKATPTLGLTGESVPPAGE
ncbi:MAG: CNNM domain-containing protein [Saprospiraceae bacterium]